MHQSLLLSLLSMALAPVHASPALEARDPTRSCSGYNEGETVAVSSSRFNVNCNMEYGPFIGKETTEIEGLDLTLCMRQCQMVSISQCKVATSDGRTCRLYPPGVERQPLSTVHTGQRITPQETQQYYKAGVKVHDGSSGICTESDRNPKIVKVPKGFEGSKGGPKVAVDTFFYAQCNTDCNPARGDSSRLDTANFDICLLDCAALGEKCKGGSFHNGGCSFKHTADQCEPRLPSDSGLRMSHGSSPGKTMQMAVRLPKKGQGQGKGSVPVDIA
ncbi:MAG: hypothetical protein M1823_005825 [Watsoniomyces obsoletus]|nr:MAG: hypothetical protein M1823_005825 [Watsoniomyces obsoletus]